MKESVKTVWLFWAVQMAMKVSLMMPMMSWRLKMFMKMTILVYNVGEVDDDDGGAGEHARQGVVLLPHPHPPPCPPDSPGGFPGAVASV